MRVRRSVVPACVAALLACSSAGDAVAFTASIAVSKEKTSAFSGREGVTLAPYGEAIQQTLLAEVKRSHVPFALAAPASFVVQIVIDRRGQVLSVEVARGGGIEVIDDYLKIIVRQASRHFPPPPAEVPGERLSFTFTLNIE